MIGGQRLVFRRRQYVTMLRIDDIVLSPEEDLLFAFQRHHMLTTVGCPFGSVWLNVNLFLCFQFGSSLLLRARLLTGIQFEPQLDLSAVGNFKFPPIDMQPLCIFSGLPPKGGASYGHGASPMAIPFWGGASISFPF